MDLILLEPGNAALFDGYSGAGDAGASAREKWPGLELDLGLCYELVSIRQGMKQQVSTDVSNSARTSGRPVITEFTLTRYVDQASVKFYDLCLRAEPLGKGAGAPTRLHILRTSGEQPALVLTFALRDAIISEIELQSHPDDMPTEQFKLNFTEILWTCGMPRHDGRNGSVQTTGWSLARNRPIGQLTV